MSVPATCIVIDNRRLHTSAQTNNATKGSGCRPQVDQMFSEKIVVFVVFSES